MHPVQGHSPEAPLPPPLTQRGQTLLELGLRARGEGGGGGSSEALPGRRAQRRAAGPSYRATRALPNLVTPRGSSASDPSRPGQARPSASTVGWGVGRGAMAVSPRRP